MADIFNFLRSGKKEERRKRVIEVTESSIWKLKKEGIKARVSKWSTGDLDSDPVQADMVVGTYWPMTKR